MLGSDFFFFFLNENFEVQFLSELGRLSCGNYLVQKIIWGF